MRPSFNTTGPCYPDEHYMLPPSLRLGRVMELIDEGKYFTLHSGRQTGKTTSAQWLCDHYNAGSTYCALWVDVQNASDRPDPATAFRIVLDNLDTAVARVRPSLEVEELLVQHTAKTGQRFEPEAIALIQHLSQGHPCSSTRSPTASSSTISATAPSPSPPPTSRRRRRPSSSTAARTSILRSSRSWDQRLSLRELSRAGKTIHVVGC